MRQNVDVSTTTVVITGVANKQLFVTSCALIAAGAVNITLKDSDDNVLMGPIACGGAGDGLVLGFNPEAWVETPVAKGLKLVLSAAVQVGGVINYRYYLPTVG